MHALCLQGAPDVDGRALRAGLQALGHALRPDELAQLVRQLGGGRALGRAELAAGLLDWPALQASPDPLCLSHGSGFVRVDDQCAPLAIQKLTAGLSTGCAAGTALTHVRTSARGQVSCNIAYLAHALQLVVHKGPAHAANRAQQGCSNG